MIYEPCCDDCNAPGPLIPFRHYLTYWNLLLCEECFKGRHVRRS